jgi:hypothetical protein
MVLATFQTKTRAQSRSSHGSEGAVLVDLGKHVAELRSNLGADSLLVTRIEAALCRRSDLRAFRDHLGVVRLCSAGVNGLCDLMEVTHRTDAAGAIEVLPHVREDGLNIYSDPCIFVVGHANDKGFGECPLADWSELLADHGLPRELISKVRLYLNRHKPVSFEECGP